MADNLPIMILDGSQKLQNSSSGAKIIGLEFDVLGQPLRFRISVTRTQARLADIVPLARTICTKISDVAVKNTS